MSAVSSFSMPISRADAEIDLLLCGTELREVEGRLFHVTTCFEDSFEYLRNVVENAWVGMRKTGFWPSVGRDHDDEALADWIIANHDYPTEDWILFQEVRQGLGEW